MSKALIAEIGNQVADFHGLRLDQGQNNATGAVHLANEERFTAANFSEPLTTYAVGWDDPNNIQATLDAVAPPVQVPRRFEYKEATNIESFLSDSDDIRAIGSPHKRIEQTGTSTNQRTLNKGLTMRLDRDEEAVAGGEEAAVARMMNRLFRNDLRRAITALSGSGTNTAKTWDASAGKDPDMDVITDLIAGGDARGMQSNTIVYGDTSWSKRLLSFRAQDLAGQGNSSNMTMAELEGFFGVDKIVLSKERYQSTASAKTKILQSYVLMYFAQQNLSKDDASNIKQFWTPTDSGRVRVYREERAKFVDITVEHYSNIVLTSTLGLRRFTVS